MTKRSLSKSEFAQTLKDLAQFCGLALVYENASKKKVFAKDETLLLALNSLGLPVLDHPHMVEEIFQEVQIDYWRSPCPTVQTFWTNSNEQGPDSNSAPFTFSLRIPQAMAGGELDLEIVSEEGNTSFFSGPLKKMKSVKAEEVLGDLYFIKKVQLPFVLPWGYYQVSCRIKALGTFLPFTQDLLWIVAPKKAYSHFASSAGKGSANRGWGLFVPLYSLTSKHSQGIGDFSDLLRLSQWVQKQGGLGVATLPILSSFLNDTLFEPGPYSPASRLFLNEIFLDLTKVKEIRENPKAQKMFNGPTWEDMRKDPHVDYAQVIQKKRALLELGAKTFFQGIKGGGEGTLSNKAYQNFLRENPLVLRYAQFQAMVEGSHKPWREWKERIRDGNINEEDIDDKKYQYHLYAQWLVHTQLKDLTKKLKEKGLGPYLDLPLGVNGNSFDVWNEKRIFVTDVSVGAPPDLFFTKGQNWGFPPFHPKHLRDVGYRYFRLMVKNHMRFADLLRLDHVQGYQRLYWIPQGVNATDGVYMNYPTEEFYAILNLESHRFQTTLIGEDLGTVPKNTERLMEEHGLNGMYVLPFEITSQTKKTIRPIEPHHVTSLNTHDMPTFQGFWEGKDIEDRMELGLIEQGQENKEWKNLQKTKEHWIKVLRESQLLELDEEDEEVSAEEVMKAALRYLAKSSSPFLVINLEDLWLESFPQNVPGTSTERPNWKRKLKFSLEEIIKKKKLSEFLQSISALRQEETHGKSKRPKQSKAKAGRKGKLSRR